MVARSAVQTTVSFVKIGAGKGRTFRKVMSRIACSRVPCDPRDILRESIGWVEQCIVNCLLCFYDRDGVCLLRGTDWVFVNKVRIESLEEINLFIEAIPLCVNTISIYIYIYIYIYLRHTQQLTLKFTQLSATSSMATCFGHPCDHHQANLYRSCAFNVLMYTLWDPIL